mmetsp:Transcript_148/g.329  ORF Transcript_148/g.329 Transcript_148/m.329 type:complete len:248 (+) Transcript_148:2101-2844(+)
MFEASDLPPVRSRMRSSRKGVTLLPAIPLASASLSACLMADSTSAPSAASPAGMGTASTMPLANPSDCEAAIMAAACCGVSTREGAAQPERGVKNAGNSAVPYAATATPCVSRYSSVRGMSSTDFAPAHTTITGVRPSSVRSALTSHVTSPPLCTPPMPPVTNTRMPAAAASSMVADTVVAPSPFKAMMCAMSRLETLATLVPDLAMCSNWARSRPMHGCPAMMAIVAGTAPPALTTSSTSKAVCKF